MKSLVAIGNRIHIRPDLVDDKTKGGLLLPMSAVEKAKAATVEGVVVDMGPDAFANYPYPWVNEGDHVVYVKHAGWTGEDDEGEIRVILDEDVVARIVEWDEDE